MPDALPEIVAFLAWSSAELVILGVAVWAICRVARPGPAFTRRALALLVVLPVLALGAWLLPTPAWLTVRTSLVSAPPTTAHTRAHVSPSDFAVHTVSDGGHLSSIAVPASTSRALSVDWRGMLAALWAAGVLTTFVVGWRRLVALRRLLRQTHRVSNARVRRLLVDAAATLGVRRPPRLRAIDRPDVVPFLVGTQRPVIVVSSRLLAGGAHEALRFALLHELAHLRHRDHRWVVPELLLRAGYFFHPVVHHALSRLQEERECRADRVVARVSGRRAAYADFLLDEIEITGSRVPSAPALALGRGPGSVARRIHRLLDRGESTMQHSVRNTIAAALTAAILLCLLGITAGPLVADDVPAPPSADPRFGSINAVATDAKGVYRVYPVFEDVLGVHVVPQGGPYDAKHRRELTEGSDYTMDLAKGVLRFSVPVDPKTEFVSVRGYRVIPWQWILGRPFAPDSVTVAFKDREGARGVDFEVDEAAGTIRFLKPELCHRKQQYSIVYRHPVDPAKPRVAPGGTIGTFVAPPRPREARTGQRPAQPAPKDISKAVGTNATRTADPRTWTLAQPLRSDGLRVAVAKRGAPGDLRWLERGKDYVYDPAHGKLVLSADVRVHGDSEYVFVHGVPADRGLVLRQEAIGDDVAIKVVVGSKRLAEGEGYEVDRPAGRIRILDAAIQTPRTPFYVQVGSWSYGSYQDRDALKKLLAD